MTIRIVLADDQPLIRTALAALIARADDLDVVGEAGDGRTAVDLVRRHRPDVAVLWTSGCPACPASKPPPGSARSSRTRR